jgi:hypothetical protein
LTACGGRRWLGIPWRHRCDACGALLFFVVNATIVSLKAVRDNDEDF